MKRFLATVFWAFFLVNSSLAHKDLWEIKATALPNNDNLSFSIFFSLEQLKASFPEKLNFDSYLTKDKEKLTVALAEIAPQVLTFFESKKAVAPFVRSVNIITNSFDEEDIEEFSISQVDVEMELIYPLDHTKNTFSIEWHAFADDLIKAKNIKRSEIPNDALDVSIFILDHQLSKFTVSPEKSALTWKRLLPKVQNTLDVKTTKVKTLQKRTKLAYVALISFIAALVLWSFSLNKVINKAACLLLILAICFFVLSFTKKETVHKISQLPEEDKVSEFMGTILPRLYKSVNRDEWEGLDSIIHTNFKKDLILKNFRPDSKKNINHVEAVEIDNILVREDKTVHVEWTVKTIFQHISHIHEKTLNYSGTFSFIEQNSNWLISHANIRQKH